MFRIGVYEVGKDTLRRASGAYWCLMPDATPGTALVIWRDWESGAPVAGGCGSVTARFSRHVGQWYVALST